VVCVNLMDEAKRKGIEVDVRSLSRDLGVPAVPTVARTKEGLQQLVSTVADVITGTIATKPLRPAPPPGVQEAVADLVPMIHSIAPDLPNAQWVAVRLLDGDHRVRQALLSGELAQLVGVQRAPVETTSRVVAIQGRQ
jgi:ferrous iron transport protein B